MKHVRESMALFGGVVLCGGALFLSGCGAGQAGSKADFQAEAPPPVQVEHEQDLNLVKVDHPEHFVLATAGSRAAAAQLAVTGVVSPDVSRTVPVVSVASGRVVEIHARLGDTVIKGQLLLRVQSSDISSAFSDYRKALADEVLAKTQFERARDLREHGAASMNDLQVAQDTEAKAQVDVETAAEHLRLLGGDPDRPMPAVDLRAPVSGVITDQQVAQAGGVQGLGSTPFTISDLSSVWILCDVYENDLPSIRLGESAEIRLNAYPDRLLKGTISNIRRGPRSQPAYRESARAAEQSRLPPRGHVRHGEFRG